MSDDTATPTAILDAAERMIQAVGYNGLSFRDLASDVGIKSSSVHYHFPTKGHLGAAVARRYTDRMLTQMEAVAAATSDAATPIAVYVAAIRSTLERDGRMCLCGMLAAEADAIPPEVRVEVRRFIETNGSWVMRMLARNVDAPGPESNMRDRAASIVAALEGAMLMARGTGDITVFDAVVSQYRRVGLLL